VKSTGFDVVTWYGMWAPKGTPSGIVERLNAEIRKASNTEEVSKVLAQQGTEASQLSVGEFAAFAEAENRKWVKVMADAKIQPE
jgi:tripartite-type tricarboxylate transporter receptor subunit TctC